MQAAYRNLTTLLPVLRTCFAFLDERTSEFIRGGDGDTNIDGQVDFGPFYGISTD
jgi:hypothetical protein